MHFELCIAFNCILMIREMTVVAVIKANNGFDSRWQQAPTGEQKIFCNLILSGLVKSCVLLYGRNFE